MAEPVRAKEWTVTFVNDRMGGNHAEHVVERWEVTTDQVTQFNAAVRAKKYKGRAVRSMWIIDWASEFCDVIQCWNRPDLEERHQEYLARAKDTTPAKSRAT